MTHPPATCELCGDTGLYSPSAVPCPKGCSAEDIVDRLRSRDLDLSPDWRDDADMHSWMDTADALMSESAEYITNLRKALSEAEQREKDAKRIAVNAEAYGYGHGIEVAEKREKSARETALEEAALRIDCNCNERCLSQSDYCPKQNVAAIRDLKDEVR